MMKGNMNKLLIGLLTKALKKLNISPVPSIEIDVNPSVGDYSTNIAMTLFSKLPKGTWESPRAFAITITETVLSILKEEDVTEIAQVLVAGPGFINFTLSQTFLQEKLELMHQDPFSDLSKVVNKKVVVEYSNPNIAKPFTVGHLRSTI